MNEKRKCKDCGEDMNDVYSFVFGTTFYFCPNKCGQVKAETIGWGK